MLCGATHTPFRGDRGAVSPSKGEGPNSYCEVREERIMRTPRLKSEEKDKEGNAEGWKRPGVGSGKDELQRRSEVT